MKLGELERACFAQPWSVEQYAVALAQKHFGALGLFVAKELRGYISFYHLGEDMEIINFAVHRHHRRQGYGTQIIRALLQVAHKMGMQRVSLEVRQGNSVAVALYTGVGFCQAGRRKGYYPDTGEDALVMIRDVAFSTPSQ